MNVQRPGMSKSWSVIVRFAVAVPMTKVLADDLERDYVGLHSVSWVEGSMEVQALMAVLDSDRVPVGQRTFRLMHRAQGMVDLDGLLTEVLAIEIVRVMPMPPVIQLHASEQALCSGTGRPYGRFGSPTAGPSVYWWRRTSPYGS